MASAVTKQVLFDLETTGLERDSHILQIAALGPNGSFCKYVLPKKEIHPKAAEVNGLTFDGQNLLLNGWPVPCVTIGQALAEFLEFLGNQPVTLFAHNAKVFDSVVLLNAVVSCDMLSEFDSRVTGFVDTLPLFKKLWPDLPSYSQPALYEHFFQSSYTAHEAMNDVEALKRLLDLSEATTDDFDEYFFSVQDVLKCYLLSKLTRLLVKK